MKQTLLTILIGLTLTGCSSCLYEVHEETTPLGIKFYLEPNSSERFQNYIDTLNSMAVNRCQYTAMQTDKGYKVLCLSECECYFVIVQNDNVLIPAVFVPTKSTSAWLTKREQIEDATISRLKEKFQVEVISKFGTELKTGTVSR